MKHNPRLLAAAVTLALTACNVEDMPETMQAQGAGQGIDLPDHGANAVADWHTIGRITISPAGVPGAPTPSERVPTYELDMAALNLAIYDALALITRRYQSFTPGVTDIATVPADSPATQQYAVHGAGCTVLAGLFPSRGGLAGGYGTKCTTVLQAAGASESDAFNFGKAVAERVLTWRANDGRETPKLPFSNIPITQISQFRSLNPNPAVNPVGYSRQDVRPFSLSSSSQFRADGPPALTSAEYTANLDEVRALGRADSTMRTEVQTQNARFHTMAPPLFWMSNLQQFSTSQPTLMEDARLMAALWIAQADATTACFESKYYYNSWRPVTAINLGDPFGHAADPSWQPVVPTPNHPEYPAAHACNTGAVVEVLDQIFGTRKLRFTFTTNVASVAPAYAQQSYKSTDEFVNTVQEARIAGGMHFRTSTVHGDVMGMKVSKQLLREHFQRVR